MSTLSLLDTTTPRTSGDQPSTACVSGICFYCCELHGIVRLALNGYKGDVTVFDGSFGRNNRALWRTDRRQSRLLRNEPPYNDKYISGLFDGLGEKVRGDKGVQQMR